MFTFDSKNSRLVGTHGSLLVKQGDDASLKIAMLLQGECTQIGPTQAAKNFKYSKSRYYQIRAAFLQQGSEGILPKKPGPKRNYRRTPAVNKCVIRARFLDPDVSAEVIASKLRQDGYLIATRSVERIISQYGLQKKTPHSFSQRRPKKG